MDLSRGTISKLNSLLESLLILSRLDADQSCIITQKIKFKSYVDEKINVIAKAFPEKKYEFHFHGNQDTYISVREDIFEVYMDNLITNAFKFSAEKVQIHIDMKEEAFSFSDRGKGISGDIAPKIWEKFYREDTNKPGFGVGLYLVKRIIEVHGWSIDVDTSHAGGAKFDITFR